MSILHRFMAVSKLDEHTQFLKGTLHDYGDDPPEYTSELFIRKLLKLEPPTDKMTAGTIVHSLIENSIFNLLYILPQKVRYDGWKIIFEKEIKLSIPSLREISIYKTAKGIPIFGRVDAINGTTIHDIKTTSIDNVERYIRSWQWKTYLWMANYDNFVYNVLLTRTDAENKTIYVVDNYDFSCTRYKQMDEEVESKIAEYYFTLERLEPEIIRIATENNIILTERTT